MDDLSLTQLAERAGAVITAQASYRQDVVIFDRDESLERFATLIVSRQGEWKERPDGEGLWWLAEMGTVSPVLLRDLHGRLHTVEKQLGQNPFRWADEIEGKWQRATWSNGDLAIPVLTSGKMLQ